MFYEKAYLSIGIVLAAVFVVWMSWDCFTTEKEMRAEAEKVVTVCVGPAPAFSETSWDLYAMDADAGDPAWMGWSPLDSGIGTICEKVAMASGDRIKVNGMIRRDPPIWLYMEEGFSNVELVTIDGQDVTDFVENVRWSAGVDDEYSGYDGWFQLP